MPGGWGRLAQGIVDGRATDGDRGLLVAGQIGDGWLVKAGPGIYVDCIRDVVGLLGFSNGRMHGLVLACRREQQAAVRGKCKTSEEGGQGLVEVEGRVAEAHGAHGANAGGVWHDGGQGHGRSGRGGAAHGWRGAEGRTTAVRGRRRMHRGQGQRLGRAGHRRHGRADCHGSISGKGAAAEVWGRRAVGRDAAGGQVHLGDLAVLGQREVAVLVLQGVDVDGAVRRLGCNVLVHGVPGNALDVVVVLGNLPHDAS